MNNGYIAIKFDDGNASDYTVAYQEQLKRGMTPKGTSFLIGSYIVNENPNSLTIAQCKELRDAGWSLQDHSYSHPSGESALINMTGDQILSQLHQQNEFFADYLNMPKPRIFQCPNGAINKLMQNVISLERDAIVFGQPYVLTTPFTNRFEMGTTFHEPQEGDPADIVFRLIDDAMENGYAVNFGFHAMDVGSSGHKAYCDILDYGIRVGATFVTLEEEIDIFQLKGIHRLDKKFGITE